MATATAAAVALATPACTGGAGGAGPDPGRPDPSATAATSSADPAAAAVLCAQAVPSVVPVSVDGLREASGLVASRRHAGVLWAHDDSGGAAEVVALASSGSDAGRAAVSGAGAVDWEDIAVLPAAGDGPDRLVIGDIGDNPGASERVTVPPRLVVVDEPVPPGRPTTVGAAPAVQVALAYADGARDAETVLGDPRTGDVLVVSKQWDLAAAGVYRVPAEALVPTPDGTPVVMERLGSVGGSTASLVTGGDVSADGSLVALRTYADVRLWDRGADETVAQALARPPACRVDVAEPQGEAVAFTADGRGFVTISEGADQPLLVRHLP